jgi:NO-binding membrane sensor protein with MHYT domain
MAHRVAVDTEIGVNFNIVVPSLSVLIAIAEAWDAFDE